MNCSHEQIGYLDILTWEYKLRKLTYITQKSDKVRDEIVEDVFASLALWFRTLSLGELHHSSLARLYVIDVPVIIGISIDDTLESLIDLSDELHRGEILI